jgi:hypothetical protein
MKRISTEAYQALRDTIPVVIWNKRPYEAFLRTALRDHPELIAGVNFSETKRQVADALVDRLVAAEGRYQSVTLQFMLELASMRRFPNLEQIKDPGDRALRLSEAEAAVENLRSLTAAYSEQSAEAEKAEHERRAQAVQAAALRRFSDDLEDLRVRFIGLQSEEHVAKRGYAFEKLLADLFVLYDLEPRIAYRLDLEQIDGSFSFDTDD